MGYDMYNQYNMYNNQMYYGQNPMMQPQMGYPMGMGMQQGGPMNPQTQQDQPQPQPQPKQESGGIVGLNPKKNKKVCQLKQTSF